MHRRIHIGLPIEGYNAEEEEEKPADEPPKSAEEKLSDLEEKYCLLEKENKEFKEEIKQLKSKLKNTNYNSNSLDEEADNTEAECLPKLKSKGFRKTNPQSEPEINLKCTICKKKFKNKEVLRTHMKSHDNDGDWTCNECSHQTNNEDNLKNHKNFAHYVAPKSNPSLKDIQDGRNDEVRPLNDGKDTSTTCNKCKKDFIYRIDLTKHIREEHKTFKPCLNINNCTFLPRCRFNHKVYPKGTQICYECEFTCKSLHELMRHRKNEHTVPMCRDFLKKNCGFSSEDCYHSHGNQSQQSPVKNMTKQTNQSQSSGFWEYQTNMDPPFQYLAKSPSLQGPSQEEWIQMKTMMKQLNVLMTKFQ